MTMKRMLAGLLSLCLMIGLAAVPGAAETETPFTVSVSGGTGAVGYPAAVNINLSGNQRGVQAITLRVYYKADTLTLDAAGMDAEHTLSGQATLYRLLCDANAAALDDGSATAAVERSPVDAGNPNRLAADGYTMASLSFMTNLPGGICGEGTLASLHFTVSGEAEPGETDVIVDLVRAEDGNAAGTGAVKITETATVPGKITIRRPGMALSAPEITVDGTADQASMISAVSTAGIDAANDGRSFSVSPAGQGVTVSGSTVHVGRTAAAGTYTITADPASDLGSATSAVLTVTRAAQIPGELQLSGGAQTLLIPGIGEAAATTKYLSTISDQYGDAFPEHPAIEWSISPETAGITITDGTVTVTDAAATAITGTAGLPMTVTARCGDCLSFADLTVKRDIRRAATLEISGDAGIDVPKTEGGQTAASCVRSYTAVVRDQYGGAVDAPAIEWSATGAGVSIDENGNLRVSNTASGTVKIEAVYSQTVSGEYTVTLRRETPAAAELVLSGGSECLTVPASGIANRSAPFAVTVYDQYGGELTGQTIDWTVSDTTGISAADGIVSVGVEAKQIIADPVGRTVTLTATVRGTEISASRTLTVRRAEPVVTKVTVSGGSAALEIPTGETAAGSAPFLAAAEDQYGAMIAEIAPVWTVLDDGSEVPGVTIIDGVVSVDRRAKDAVSDTTGRQMAVFAAVDGVTSEAVAITVKRAAPVAASVELFRDGAALPEGTDALLIPAAGAADHTYTYTAKAYDQYGAELAAAFDWTFSEADSYVTFADGLVTVKAGAEADAGYTVMATVRNTAASASASVTVKGIEVTWPTVTVIPADQIIYGLRRDQIVSFSGGTATLNGTTVDGVFSLKQGSAIPAAGEASCTLNFKSAEYDLDFTPLTVTVLPRLLTLTDGGVGVTKVYDGTDAAGELSGCLGLSGSLGTDEVTVDMTGVTVDAYPETACGTYAVTLRGIRLRGADMANYTVAESYEFRSAAITKREQDTLTLADLAVTYGAEPFEITVGGGSGTGAVTLTSSDPTVLTVTKKSGTENIFIAEVKASGTAVLTANRAGDGNYAAAEPVTASVSVAAQPSPVIFRGVSAMRADGTEDPRGNLTVTADGDSIVVSGTMSEGSHPVLDASVAEGFSLVENAEAGTYTLMHGGTAAAVYTLDTDGIAVLPRNMTVFAGTVLASTDSSFAADDFTPGVDAPNAVYAAAKTATELAAALEQSCSEEISAAITGSYAVEVTVNLGISYCSYQPVAERRALVMDVSPTYTAIAVPNPGAGGTGTDVILANEAPITGTLPTKLRITVNLPAGFFPTVAKHSHGQKTEYLPVTVDALQHTASWVMEDFSPVTLIEDHRSAEVCFRMEDQSERVMRYTVTEIGTALPEDQRTGSSFDGWSFAMNGVALPGISGPQRVLTEDLLQALNGKSGVTATAVFTKDPVSPTPDGPTSAGGGAVAPTYAVVIAETQNGTVTASAARAAAGKQVTVTPEPAQGCRLRTLRVTDAAGDLLELTERKGSFSFLMPDTDVLVTAEFAADKLFADVSPEDYWYDAVLWAVEQDMTQGVSETLFAPEDPCTRAQVVTFLWRIAGEPEPSAETSGFADVSAEAYYFRAVRWAVEQGITLGVSEMQFDPEGVVDRGQFVTFLWRFAGKPTAKAPAVFSDVSEDAFYADAVAWAAGIGLTRGTSPTCFSPEEPCVRGQVVTFLYRRATQETH